MKKKELKAKAKRVRKFVEKIKIKDDTHLRDVLNNKLVWVVNERNKGLKLIEETKIKVLKLSGMIMLINNVLSPKKEEK